MEKGGPLVGAGGVSLGRSPGYGCSGLCENPTPKRVLQVEGAHSGPTETVQEGRASGPPTMSP